MSIDREKRLLLNTKGIKANLQTGVPSRSSGNNGEERIVKTSDGRLRLYRKELGAWYYLEFTRS
jgi:hypothetical protein|tara:strand:+ start:31 stop:222 length:192 start_codon:yes stop_codon:yes gene_type:complete